MTEWVKTSSLSPDEILSNFRNSYFPRIAVTVDMISTGTDVKPIECVFFMRNVKSAGFFEQMKGRGVRVISPDKLKVVTPSAKAKDRFIIVDAVGVCEQDKTDSHTLNRKPSTTLPAVAGIRRAGRHRSRGPHYARRPPSAPAARVHAEQLSELRDLAGGKSFPDLAGDLMRACDPDAQITAAQAAFSTPSGRATNSQAGDRATRATGRYARS